MSAVNNLIHLIVCVNYLISSSSSS